MGGVSSKEKILARIDELDKNELTLNIQLRAQKCNEKLKRWKI